MTDGAAIVLAVAAIVIAQMATCAYRDVNHNRDVEACYRAGKHFCGSKRR